MRRAAVSYVEREDGRLLCVWNGRYGCWTLPGGMVEDGESTDDALERELREETGVHLASCELLYEGPHGVEIADPTRAKLVSIFHVEATGQPREMEIGRPVTWLTREEFLKWSSFRTLYEKVFALVAPRAPRVAEAEPQDGTRAITGSWSMVIGVLGRAIDTAKGPITVTKLQADASTDPPTVSATVTGPRAKDETGGDGAEYVWTHGDHAHVSAGPHCGATGRVDFIDREGGRALIDCGEGRKGGLTWVELAWIHPPSGQSLWDPKPRPT